MEILLWMKMDDLLLMAKTQREHLLQGYVLQEVILPNSRLEVILRSSRLEVIPLTDQLETGHYQSTKGSDELLALLVT